MRLLFSKPGCARALVAVAAIAVLATSSAPAVARPNGAPVHPPRQGHTAAPVGAELLLLHGTNNGTGIDPKLGKIPALRKPPFSAYNSYELIRRENLSLPPNRASSTKLPNKGDLVVTFQGLTEPRKKGDPKRYVVNVSIKRHGSTILPLLQVNATAGETLFAAVPGYKGGVLVIGIKIVP